MLVLSMWDPSGRPRAVLAPSSVWVATGSPALPSFDRFLSWKLPAASVNPIGPACRWSCHLLTKKKTWVAFCARLTCQENRLFGFQVQGHGLLQNDFANGRRNGCSL